MEIIKFLNKAACSKAAKKLRTASEMGGIEDTATGKVLCVQEQCDYAAQLFEDAAKNNGNYFSNIIKTPHFSLNEQSIIAKYL